MNDFARPIRTPSPAPLKTTTRVLRLGLPRHAPRRLEAQGFKAALLRHAGIHIQIVALPTYSSLFVAVDSGLCDVAWAPPLVALDLARCGIADPLLVLVRSRSRAYYSALVVRTDGSLRGVSDLRGRSIGWIAPESASGYVVPRLHLRSHGVDVDAFFGRESFMGTHAQAAAALESGSVDAIATYAERDDQGRIVPPRLAVPCRVLTAAGPIPGDVIVTRRALSPALRLRLERALLGLTDEERSSLVPLMNAQRFEPASASHLEPLRALSARAAEGALRPAHRFDARTSVIA